MPTPPTTPALLSLDDARSIISRRTPPLDPVSVFLAHARGRVLAEGVEADAFYPSGNRSMMDGYVVREEDGPGEFRLAGTIRAGDIPDRVLERGECMKILTGALLPEGGGRVVMQEDAERDGKVVRIAAFGDRRFIRAKGSEAIPGQVILEAGTVLGAAELAILAQVGKVSPQVIRQPVVRHLATGDEIVAPEEIPGEGGIRDTNSILLAALFAELGIEIFSERRSDDLEALTRAAEAPCDLLVISGGAGGGDFDFGARVLRRLGYEIHFDRANLRPGKPLTFATRGKQAAFVLPGNPVSHFVCFQVAVRLAVERMQGKRPRWDWLSLELKGGEPLGPDPRETCWPARAFMEEGKWFVAPKRWSTSGDTFSLAGANALVRVNENSPSGGRAETLLLDVPEGK